MHNLGNLIGLEHDYDIIYRKDYLNHAPDALSKTSEKLDSIASTLSIVGEKEKLNKFEDDWYNHNMMRIKKTPLVPRRGTALRARI